MTAFREDHYDVNGVDTAVFTAGKGAPLLFLHGGGTVEGFDSLLPLAEHAKLIVPNHPGFGASADDKSIDSLHDYVLHYLDLFDVLELEAFTLIGLSLGGYFAALLAIEQPHRFKRLVLAAPGLLHVPEHPATDLFSVPDEEVLGYLTTDLSLFDGKIPMPPTPEFLAERYREATSLARVLWKRNYDPKLTKWLHRITMPTLIVWGEADRVVPVEQSRAWASHLPDVEVKTFPGVGHLVFLESREAVDAVGDFVGAEVVS
jgi:pimeloyl-ACP methyl ester carboxylesterase